MHSNGIVFGVLTLISSAIRVCKSTKSFHLSIIIGPDEGVTHPGSGHAETGFATVAPLTGENVAGDAIVLTESIPDPISGLTWNGFEVLCTFVVE